MTTDANPIHPSDLPASPAATLDVESARPGVNINRLWRGIECALLFIGIPLVLTFLPRGTISPIMVLAAATVGTGLFLAFDKSFDRSVLTRVSGLGRQLLLSVLPVYLLGWLALWGAMMLIEPSRPFAFPLQRPGVWVMVMLLYPIFSVIPQTLIYRVFFFHRYESLFGTRTALIVAATLVFALGHLMFHSWVAIALTLAGGLLFSIRYATTRSAPLSAIEHALFGQMAFTLGYGMFLYHGSVQAAGG